MSTPILDLMADAQSSVKLRWQEPYVSEGLNRKNAYSTPSGIYRGFSLTTNGTALTITVAPDPTFGDHVAVYQTGTGYSLAIHKSTGAFSLNLSAFASQTVAIAIFSVYTTGAPTTSQIYVYEISPTNQFDTAPERGELIVLGQVVVPASGVIPAGNITARTRTSAWETIAPEAVPFTPIVTNPGFEEGPVGDITAGLFQALPAWSISATGASAKFLVNATDNATPYGRRCLELQSTSSGTVSPQITLASIGYYVPVFPGQLLKVSVNYKPLVANTSGNPLFLSLVFASEETTSPSIINVVSDPIPLTTPSSNWQNFSQIIQVPAGAGILIAFGVGGTSPQTFTSGSSGTPFLRLDDAQVWIQSEVHQPRSLEQQTYDIERLGASIWRASSVGQQINPPDATHREGFQLFTNTLFTLASVAYAGWSLTRSDQSTSSTDQLGFDQWGPVRIGAGLDAAPLAPRLTTATSPPVSGRSLVWQTTSTTAPVGGVKIYHGQTSDAESEFVLALNATWSNGSSQWSQDDPANPSLAIRVYGDNGGSDVFQHMTFLTQALGSSPWNDGSWNQPSLDLFTIFQSGFNTTPGIEMLNQAGFGGLAALGDSNPSFGGGFPNGGGLLVAEAANLPFTSNVAGVTNSSGLIEIHTTSTYTATQLSTGQNVKITGVGGVPANGTWTVTVIDNSHFTLNGSSFSGAYTSGGTVAAFAAGAMLAMGGSINGPTLGGAFLQLLGSVANTVNPAVSNTVTPNTLTGTSMPKAWAYIHTDGSGGIFLRGSFGIASATFNGTDFIIVTFQNAFVIAVGSTIPQAAFVMTGQGAAIPLVNNSPPPTLTTMQFSVTTASGGIGTNLNLTTTIVDIYLAVFGTQ